MLPCAMDSAHTLVRPAAGAAGFLPFSCGPAHSCRAARNRYLASGPAYSQSRVNVTMDRAIATPLFLITSMQPLCFHAIAHSFAQQRAAIHCAFNNLRTLSIAIGGGTPLPFTTFSHSFSTALCFHTLTNCPSRNSLAFTTIRIAWGWTPTLDVRAVMASSVQFVRS